MCGLYSIRAYTTTTTLQVFLSKLWRTKFDGIRHRLKHEQDVTVGVHKSKKAWRMGIRGRENQQEREYMIASEKEEEVERDVTIFIQV